MSDWLVTRDKLSNHQIEIIKLPIDKNIILTGAPGSGKTLILAYRLNYILNELKIQKERIVLFVYTVSLSSYIRSAVTALNIPSECVTNFDKWCYGFYKKYVSRTIPRIGNYPDYEEIKENTLEYLEHNKVQPIFDVVLVDEGQDLKLTAFKILRKISNHITVCLDEKQQLYIENTNSSEIEKILNVKYYDTIKIIEAWRCSPYVVKIASEFIEDEQEREFFVNQNRKPLIENELPYVALSSDYEKVNKKLFELIKERMLKNDSIAILVSKNRVCNAIGYYLRNNGIDAEFNSAVDFNSSKPKVMTFHSAKGLTFDSVFMPSLVTANFSKFSPNITKRMLFVGITRAVKWLYMDFNPDSKIEILSVLTKLQSQNQLKIENLDTADTVTKIELDFSNPLDLL